MFENKKRIKSYLETIIQETELIPEMSKTIENPRHFQHHKTRYTRSQFNSKKNA